MPPMSKELNLAQRLRRLKVGQSFLVKTAKEQRQVCTMAKFLREGGFIDFDIITKTTNEGIKVMAA